MAIEVTIPRLGWNMDEGVFAGWLKDEGTQVRPGDLLFSLEGAKATEDIESFDSGTLRIPPGAPVAGDPVRVGDVIGYLVGAGEAAPFETAGTSSGQKQRAASARPAASPSVRRLARESGVEIEQ